MRGDADGGPEAYGAVMARRRRREVYVLRLPQQSFPFILFDERIYYFIASLIRKQ